MGHAKRISQRSGKPWTDDEIRVLKKNYALPNSVITMDGIAAILKRSTSSVENKVYKLGLTPTVRQRKKSVSSITPKKTTSVPKTTTLPKKEVEMQVIEITLGDQTIYVGKDVKKLKFHDNKLTIG